MSDAMYRLMADYSANPLWALEGGPLTTDEIYDLNLSYTLTEELFYWQAMWETNTDYYEGADPKHVEFDYKFFSAWGYAIAHKLVQEMRQSILYFDDKLNEYVEIKY